MRRGGRGSICPWVTMYRVHSGKQDLVGAVANQADLEPQIHPRDEQLSPSTKTGWLETADTMIANQFQAGLAKVPRRSTSEGGGVSTSPR